MPRAQRYPKPTGYVLVARAVFTDDELLDDDEPYTRRLAWLWLVAHAAYKPRTASWGSIHVELDRGDILASLRTLGKHWRWTHSRVNRFLDLLVKAGRLAQQQETKAGTVYRVVKYDAYQVRQDTDATASAPPNDPAAFQRRSKKDTGNAGNTNIPFFSVAEAPAKVNAAWLTPFHDAWTELVKGTMPVGQSVNPLAQVIEAVGEAKNDCPESVRRFRGYLTRNACFSPSARKFLETHGQYAGGAIPITTGRTISRISDDEARMLQRAYGSEVAS